LSKLSIRIGEKGGGLQQSGTNKNFGEERRDSRRYNEEIRKGKYFSLAILSIIRLKKNCQFILSWKSN
jgi:hypothetical protein